MPEPWLRAVVLVLLAAFLVLGLTVNNVASTSLFLLGLIGIYVGLRRGFLNGLTRAEKLVMVAFAAYPAIAIASYILGTQTNLGFRFLGRELRLVLFIPVYLAVRWSFPEKRWIGYLLSLGALCAAVDAVVEVVGAGLGYHARGVAGVAITFGDLGLLSGFLGAAILTARGAGHVDKHRLWRHAASALGVVSGVVASILSQSRGGWIAIPVLALLVLGRLSWGSKAKAAILALCALAGLAFVFPRIMTGEVEARAQQAVTQVKTYIGHEHLATRLPSFYGKYCPDDREFLDDLIAHTYVAPSASRRYLRVVSDREALRRAGWLGRCNGGLAIALAVPKGPHGVRIVIPRSLRRPGRQLVVALARGKGRLWVAYPEGLKQLDSPGYQRYVSVGETSDKSALHLSVTPGHAVHIIPLQATYGEYTFLRDENAVGERFAMWRAAFLMFLQRPWLGVGAGAFQSTARALLRQREVSPVVWPYEHAHSDYFNRLGSAGVLGLLSLIALYAAILLGGKRRGYRSDDPSLTCLAVGLAIFGLTETMFAHSLVLSSVVMLTAGLMASGHGRKKASRPRGIGAPFRQGSIDD